jgi:serine/threonine protein kinase
VITNVGSPAYMSPELVAGTVQASHLTDIYALGVVMYYLLTGKLPFSGANTMSVIYQIVNTDPPPPSAVREGLLPEFDTIVMKAISKDPANRFQTWDEFGAALAQLWKEEAKIEEKRDETESERFQVLRNLPFFADFPENDLWEVIKLSKWAKFKPETSLIKEGDHGDSFFILAGGYVRVTRGKKTLTVLTAGDCFGEMSYLKKTGDDHRSATVTTTSDTIVMKIRADDLKQASQSVKRLFDERFLAILVARLEAANQQLSVMS